MATKGRAKALGVDDATYAHKLEVQGGGCAVCGTKPKARRLHVDHDHKTGEVRGLLCHRCNRSLPAWMTTAWMAAAASYIEKGPIAGGSWMQALERMQF